LGVWVKIFYRGTTQYDALEVSQSGFNKERILARQKELRRLKKLHKEQND